MKKLLLLLGILFALCPSVFGQYTIIKSSTSEIAYNPSNVAVTNLLVCSNYTLYYKITKDSSSTVSDNFTIKLPDGITFDSLLYQSGGISHISSSNTSPKFYNSSWYGTFWVKILVNTPSCNALATPNKVTELWGDNSSDTMFFHLDSLSIIKPQLKVNDISFPSPMSLGVGNVDEFVFDLTDFTISTDISKIYFTWSPDPNIIPFPSSSGEYYLTTTPNVPSTYYNKYTYPFLPHTHSRILHPVNIIDSLTIDSLLGSPLDYGTHIYLHVPFRVISCNDTSGSFKFYTVCSLDSSVCNVITDTTHVGIPLGDPKMGIGTDNIDNASFCGKEVQLESAKNYSVIKFKYTNNQGTYYANPPGNGRADSLRIHLATNRAVGHIDPNTIKINGVSIASTYIHNYSDGIYDVNEINLINYPAGTSGQPFGPHSIQDLDGFDHADAIAEKDSFFVSATFYYDTSTCFPFSQCSETSVYLIATGTKFNNECYTLEQETDINPKTDERIDTTLNLDAYYEYYASPASSTITPPPDIIFNTEFLLNICPNYIQNFFPYGFDFNCSDAFYSLKVALPKDYVLDTADASKLTVYAHDGNGQYSNLYQYVPTFTDSGRCTHSVDTINPLFREYFYPGKDTLVINFGKLDIDNCDYGQTYLISCINVPLILPCDTSKHRAYNETVSYTFNYTCDSLCSGCTDELVCGSTATYNHPCGTSQNIPYTKDSLLLIFRTNLGLINQNIAMNKFYTTCDSGVQAGPTDTLINKSIVNTDAVYPGDQVETDVLGGYDGLIPRDFDNEYLQIRHQKLSGSPGKFYTFELDPDVQSYFIMQGCTGVPALNGMKLILPLYKPFYTDTSTTSGLVLMNFSLDSAIHNTDTNLYNAFMADSHTENISVMAHLHLRVWNPAMPAFSYIESPGLQTLNLRNEYMAYVKSTSHLSADSLHSSDNFGTTLQVLQPSYLGFGFGAGTYVTTCDSVRVQFTLNAVGATPFQDFPNEFRPYYELDSVVQITLPAGYRYSYCYLSAFMDNYDYSSSDNHFLGGATKHYFALHPLNSNPLHIISSPTTLTFTGLNNSCFPLIDQKTSLQGYNIMVVCVPICDIQPSDTIFSCTAGSVNAAQQPDPRFQIPFPMKTIYQFVPHVNPTVKLFPPSTVYDFSNLISFTFALCDSGSYAVTNGWIAFENPGLDTLNLLTAKLYNKITHKYYYPNYYDSNTGVLFNVGALNPCDSLVFSAYIDSNSHSCPPPKDSGLGVINVRYGNVCWDTLVHPDSNSCENKLKQFDYTIYANDLVLDSTGGSHGIVSLCGDTLTENFTIESARYGTISDPMFWVKLPAGVSVQDIIFEHPCPGGKDTTIYSHDSVRFGGSLVGWKLDKDLHMHGLLGTRYPGSKDSIIDSVNRVCVTVNLKLSCLYDSLKPITFIATGISTCDIKLEQSINLRPHIDSSCCSACKFAVKIPPVNPICIGDSTYAFALDSNGISPYIYLWKPSGKSTDTISILSIGTYTVIATDSKGCFDSATTYVSSDSLYLSVRYSNVTCYGDSNRVIATGSKGTLPYFYTWSTGATSSSIYLTAGTYTVNVKDSSGCSYSTTVTISQDSLPIIHAPLYACGDTLQVFISNPNPTASYSWSTIGGSILSVSSSTDSAVAVFSSSGGSVIVAETVSLPDGSGCTMYDTVGIRSCCNDTTKFDTILSNETASHIHAGSLTYCKKHILIEGTFISDEPVNFYSCDIEFTPHAMIRVTNNSLLNITTGTCPPYALIKCSHLHATCDTMWRGIFVEAGSTLYMGGDGVLVEDADSAVVAENTPIQQAIYIIAYDYFNKNYKNIVTEPYNGTYNGEVNNNVFTCRNFHDYNTCMDTNWRSMHDTTCIYPHRFQITNMGMDFRNVGNFPAAFTSFDRNYFDHMIFGIYSRSSNLTVYNETFEFIGNRFVGAAIWSQGDYSRIGYSLTVGGMAIYQPNYFLHCYNGIIGRLHIFRFNIFNNSFDYINDRAVGLFFAQLRPSTSNVEYNKIKNAGVGINEALNVNMNGFIYSNNISSTCGSIGVKLQEFSSPSAGYVVESDTIHASTGIILNNLQFSHVYENHITLDSCTHPTYQYGIRSSNNTKGTITCNTITTGNNDTMGVATGIYSHISMQCHILGDSITNMKYGLSVWNTSGGMSILGNNLFNPSGRLATGMYFNTATLIPNQGDLIQPENNGWFGTFHCHTDLFFTPAPTFYWNGLPLNYDPTSGTGPCNPVFQNGASCTTCPTVCGAPPPPIVIRRAPLDSVATGQLPPTQTPDTTIRVAQEGLGDVVMQNPSLLSDTLLRQFNDSLQLIPLGTLMRVDTLLNSSSSSWDNSTMAIINGAAPTYNIDSNRQLASQSYLSYLMCDSLSTGQVTALRILAQKCPLWDGKAVFEARALLELYDSAETVYLDTNCICDSAHHHNGDHRPTKPKKTNTDIQTLNAQFNLYPNPNNGGFTLSYQLQNGETGEFIIYNTIGQKMAHYGLDGRSDKMSIDESTLDNGVYFYNIFVNNKIVKRDKLIIIK